jgi:hypothetical protein
MDFGDRDTAYPGEFNCDRFGASGKNDLNYVDVNVNISPRAAYRPQ